MKTGMLLLLVMLVSGLSASSDALPNAEHLGIWRLIEKNAEMAGPIPLPDTVEVRLIFTKGHFTRLSYNQKTGLVVDVIGGGYGRKETEESDQKFIKFNPKYAHPRNHLPDRDMIHSAWVRIEKEKLVIHHFERKDSWPVGIGPIEYIETYERVKK